MSEEKDKATEAGGGSGGGGGKLIVIVSIVNLLISLGVVAVIFLSFKKENSQQKVSDIDKAAAEHGEAASAEGAGHGGGDGHGGGGAGGGAHGAADAHGAKGSDKAKGDRKFGKIVTLEQFTVNLSLAGSVTPKYVRANISLEVPNAELEGEISQKMPQVRNSIIDLFNSKKPSDLGSIEGRDYLKEEIRNALNGFLVTGKVKGIFFTNFAVSG